MVVMVVDDEPDMQLLFQQQFRKELREGMIRFVFALSGEDALKHLESGDGADVVLILSDINMPGMSGLHLLRRLKAQWPQIEVYMITAYDDEENHRNAVAYGADDYLTKPVDFTTLRARILGRLS
jgi:CheY-like chemotaxis protein